MNEEIEAHLARLKSSQLIDDFAESFDFESVFCAYRPVIDAAKNEKAKASENVSELHKKILTLDKNIAARKKELDKLKGENEKLNSELESLNNEHDSLSKEVADLSRQKHYCENRLKSREKFKITKKDMETRDKVKLKAILFKNILGVKFNVMDIKNVIEGYVFNKNYLKWFRFDVGKENRKLELQRMFWKAILQGINISDWPRALENIKHHETPQKKSSKK